MKRWNRTDDKFLWKTIRIVAQESGVELEEVVDCLVSSENSPYWSRILPELRKQSRL